MKFIYNENNNICIYGIINITMNGYIIDFTFTFLIIMLYSITLITYITETNNNIIIVPYIYILLFSLLCSFIIYLIQNI